MALVSRDPIARLELHSRRDYDNLHGCGCAWCGELRHTPKGRPFLMTFWHESDGGRKSEVPGRFCTVSCYRSYHC